MSLRTRDVLETPRGALALDTARLQQYLQRTLGLAGDSPLIVKQFGHGQSNPTYYVNAGSMEIVLRKKPPGKLLASAHAVEREHRVMAALQGTGVPVPRMLALCSDASVLGTPFYLMQFVDGAIHLDASLPGLSPAQRRATFTAMCETLGKLHALDPAALGLGDYGRPANYCARQAVRWQQQYLLSTQEGAGNERLGSMTQLAAWLAAHAGAHDAALGRGAIVHGDFRLDNLVMSPDGAAVRAVLDWELSTVGDPMADVAYNCMMYHLPMMGNLKHPLPPGIPTEAEYLAQYCRAAGRPVPDAAAWTFYTALSLFRIASILAGVYTRALQGNASSKNALTVGAPAVVDGIARKALAMIAGTAGAVPAAAAAAAPAAAPAGATAPSDAPGAPGAPGLAPSPRCAALLTRLQAFLRRRIAPLDDAFYAHAHSAARWASFPQMERLKEEARTEGLWNLWMAADLAARVRPALQSAGCDAARVALLAGPGLSNLDYAYLARAMGAWPWCPEVFNCSAPDTGNMEVLARYGSPAQQRRWLVPLLAGEIRSCFAMTEKAVASSDATNVQGSVARASAGPGGASEAYVINGLKCWISGACDPRCRVAIFMGKSDPRAPPHRQQCMVLVPMPSPGVTVVRPMTVFGDDDAPHGHAEMIFDNVRVPQDNMILGEGRGFEIAQGRLGPGRLHHCMRVIGIGEAALSLAAERVQARATFGKPLAEQSLVQAQLAEAWLGIHTAWLAVLHAASELDRVGNKGARLAITAAKVAAPRAVLAALDRAIQLHGAAGVGQDTPLARYWGAVRTLRLADGPDEVHLIAIGKQAIKARSKL